MKCNEVKSLRYFVFIDAHLFAGPKTVTKSVMARHGGPKTVIKSVMARWVPITGITVYTGIRLVVISLPKTMGEGGI